MSMMNPFCLKLSQTIFLICLVLQAYFVCSKKVVRCIQSERQALLQFKAALIDDYGMLSSWTTEDCCQWKGIGCSNLTDHVIMLNLHGDFNYYNYNDGNKFYMSGDIHKSLMELQQLKYLNLGGNNFEGNYILSIFGSLRNLRYLDLSGCNLGGQIPIQFESLSHLKYLNLSNNRLDGVIPHRLGDLSNLQFLDLRNNRLEGSIPTQLGNLFDMEYLDLHRNSFKGKIPSQLGNLSNLQFLDLSYNNLEGNIPSQLGKLTNLQKLYLGGYDFGDLTMDNEDHSRGQWLSNFTSLTHLHMSSISNLYRFNSWLETVGKLPKLIELSLRNCGLSDHFVHSLSQSKFKFSTSLSILDLSRNKFVSSLIFHMVSNISSNLVELDLSGNQMVDLPSNNFSCSLPKLRELRLADNSFTSFMIFQSLSNISSNLVELNLAGNLLEAPPSHGYGTVIQSLQVLDLSYNKLKGVAFKSFMNLCALRSLDMEENNLTEDLQLIIHNLSSGCVRNSLEVLNLGWNGITGTLPGLSLFTSMKTLDLSYNKLSGKIPEGSSLPFQLEQFHIRSNSLEGGIPKSLWMNACKLKSLDLSNNSFSGELQVLIHHLSRCARYSLQQLNLRFNQINGTLPNLSIFSFLETFDISENRLNGKIFEDIRFPTTLRLLQMGSNSLNGVISDFHFSGMSMLRYLYLSDNSLALRFTENWVPPFQLYTMDLGSCKLGLTFPKWIQTQKYLHNLDISNGGISDNVPEWFWSKLSSQDCSRINISYNNLKGLIPNLQVKNHCSFLYLSSNEFEGSIPPFLRGSSFIDLSKNKFSDSRPFLCANGRDIMLRQLDLSNNKFSGGIPNCWSNFKSLVYVDLSHNNFSWKIPTSMGSLVELQALILRKNILTEEIPVSLMNCTKLVMLDLRENRLKGLIPYWIGSELKELQVLSLQRNHFFGSLPFELCYLQNIQLFDLSFNNLSGQIPKCIKNFTSMTQKDLSQDLSSHQYAIGQYTRKTYDLSAFFTWKGVEELFNNNGLFLLKSIDLSSNHFSEEIPLEIADLIQLVSLNLSRNNFTGKIPSNIGKLRSLDFLDLARNKLLGSIPSSLSQIDRLGVLDLSHNQLSGEIPLSTQLQSFNPSSYEDNLDLCGPPLVKLCVEGKPPYDPKVEVQNDEDLLLNRGFYISLTFGFIIGFWGVFGSILIKRSWRHAYFKFMNNLMDKIYVKCRWGLKD
ncbi:receptor-like protein [Medicago truncatula]|uniref:Receptor-like protein n=2 Tax=Medicago truncatula TaxID=3880 RepID=A0A072U8E0_MEDTR|nr:receptor-like protein [Medicago truncatula]